MKIIVTMGRGGTGKTSFVSMMADYFITNGDSPLLLVDLDPDQIHFFLNPDPFQRQHYCAAVPTYTSSVVEPVQS